MGCDRVGVGHCGVFATTTVCPSVEASLSERCKSAISLPRRSLGEGRRSATVNQLIGHWLAVEEQEAKNPAACFPGES